MNETHKPKRVRSPSYPSTDLETAIEKLGAMYRFTHRTPVLISVMLPHWGYESGKSANGMKMVAALKSYGLIVDQGQKDNRKISITDNGFKILNLTQDSSERKQLIQTSALAPEMYRYMWDNFSVLPHFDSIKSHLIVEKKFNESAVKGFLDDYQHTVDFAELSKSGNIDAEVSSDDSDVEIGDLVQWESGGINQFHQPKTVRAIEDYDGESWVFVTGSKTGIPMNQVIVEQKGGGIKQPPILEEEVHASSADMTVGEHEWMRATLPNNIGYRIIVSGELGPKEIDKMIKLLQAQRDVLSDDEE